MSHSNETLIHSREREREKPNGLLNIFLISHFCRLTILLIAIAQEVKTYGW